VNERAGQWLQAALGLLERLWPSVRAALLVWLGGVMEEIKADAKRDHKLVEQFKNVLHAEQENAARPDAGAADRLRRSAWHRSRP
jgi:hypothetical protein